MTTRRKKKQTPTEEERVCGKGGEKRDALELRARTVSVEAFAGTILHTRGQQSIKATFYSVSYSMT